MNTKFVLHMNRRKTKKDEIGRACSTCEIREVGTDFNEEI
jgi:hypothetical protein